MLNNSLSRCKKMGNKGRRRGLAPTDLPAKTCSYQTDKDPIRVAVMESGSPPMLPARTLQDHSEAGTSISREQNDTWRLRIGPAFALFRGPKWKDLKDHAVLEADLGAHTGAAGPTILRDLSNVAAPFVLQTSDSTPTPC
ncbi:hypothetical protein A0H81_02197 [Grifola frondosa]|uniref:Uncharacterized protein n=1 Tax=Grifola frondosa TaxID=5627 RepID=A0A1C7MM35_GRIFR|nr:hypothetical protein A0H81_02197 [Grifola frondosa]